MTFRSWAVVLCLALVGGLVAPASAQSGSMSIGLYNSEDSFRPDLSARDLKLIIRVLGLGATEQQLLNDLYSGYAATLQNEGAAVREFVSTEIDRAEIMADSRLLDKAHKKIAEWQKRSEQIKKQFLEDLKSLLTREQEGRWPIVERELRRLRLIGDGRLCGENVDLVRLTEDVIGTAPLPEVADLLNRYSNDLDKALQARETFLADKRKEFDETRKSEPKRAKAIWDDAQRVRGAVREVNERYARQLGAAMPADKKEEFEGKVFDLSYKPVTKATKAEQYLKDAAGLDSLTADQKSQVAQIKAKYETQRRELLVKAAKGWRDFEAEWLPDDLEAALAAKPKEEYRREYNGAWLPESHPLIKYRGERFELDQGLRKSLDALLTTEQKGGISSRATPYAEFPNWSPWGL